MCTCRINNVTVGGAQRGILLEGVVSSIFDNFWLYSSGSTVGSEIADSGLLENKEYTSAQSSTVYPSWTTSFSNFLIGGYNLDGAQANSCIYMNTGDGNHFVNGYVNNGSTANLILDNATSADTALNVVTFTNVYFDKGGAMSSDLGVLMPASTGTEQNNGIKFDNCSINGSDKAMSIGTEVNTLIISDCYIANTPEGGVYITDAAAGSNITITGNHFVSMGDTSGSGLKIDGAGNVVIADNQFMDITGGASNIAIHTTGTITAMTLTGNHFENNDNDYFNDSTTFTIPLVYDNNVTDDATTNLAVAGEFTATLTCGTSGTVTVDPSFNTIAWRRHGDMVYVQGQIKVSAVSSPVGTLRIGTLPFTSSNAMTEDSGVSTFSVKYTVLETPNDVLYPQVSVAANSTTIKLEELIPTTGLNQDTFSEHMKVGTFIAVSGTYITTI